MHEEDEFLEEYTPGSDGLKRRFMEAKPKAKASEPDHARLFLRSLSEEERLKFLGECAGNYPHTIAYTARQSTPKHQTMKSRRIATHMAGTTRKSTPKKFFLLPLLPLPLASLLQHRKLQLLRPLLRLLRVLLALSLLHHAQMGDPRSETVTEGGGVHLVGRRVHPGVANDGTSGRGDAARTSTTGGSGSFSTASRLPELAVVCPRKALFVTRSPPRL